MKNSRWKNETVLNDFFERIDKYLVTDLMNNKTFKEASDKCMEELIANLPELIMKAVTITMATQLANMAHTFPEIIMKTMNLEININDLRKKLSSY